MSWFLWDTWQLTWRQILRTLRLPIWIAVSLVQPIIWLGLYGQLFRRIVELPGFQTTSYITFLTPGVMIMTAFFGGGWAGMSMIDDHDQGVLSRLLATPASRGAIIAARVLHTALTVLIQSGLILALGLILGARFHGGALGLISVMLIAALLASGIGALSCGVGLLARREETLIAVMNFLSMPLTFLSTAFIAAPLMPRWIRALARINPVNWAVEAARGAALGTDSGMVLTRLALLAVFTIVCCLLATLAFRRYQRAL
ncbi:ABC transporter permease [Thermorudis peleae]|uniref:ABC transporter permease n=1 Tax=Thermorudis peleae TaxID=1382356 RepID=UPI000571057E|nr:ABC transporter permease [Thermorudis peleae]MBX6754222.1 ABC transporter permease [Thermorudis peleae]